MSTGPLIGKRLQELFEEKGVRFRLGMEVAELHGDENGKLSEVELTCGDSLSADLLVTGLGVVPCTDFLRGSEIVLDNRGYVPVDEVYWFSYYMISVFQQRKYCETGFFTVSDDQLSRYLCCRRYCFFPSVA